MDEVKIEIKDELIHQDEELQTKKKFIASSSKENTNMFCNRCVLQFEKKYVFDLHLKLVHGEKPFKEPEKLEDSETDIKPETVFSLSESELIKSEVKTEVKDETFEKFESREQDGIDFTTSKNFDQNVNVSEFPTQNTDYSIKRKMREELDESNVPLKKFKQDCTQSNHFEKSKTIEKKADLKMTTVQIVKDLKKNYIRSRTTRFRWT